MPNTATYGWEGFLVGRERVSCRFYLFRFYCRAHIRPCLTRLQGDAVVAGVVGHGRTVRKGKVSEAGRRRRFFVVSVFFATMPLTHVLPIPFSSHYLSPTQQ